MPRWDRFYHYDFLGIRAESGLEVIGLPSHQSKFLPERPDSLMVRGLHVDIVQRSSPIMSFSGGNAFDEHSNTNQWWTKLVQIICGQDTGDDQLMVLARSLAGGSNRKGEVINDGSTFWSDFAAW